MCVRACVCVRVKSDILFLFSTSGSLSLSVLSLPCLSLSFYFYITLRIQFDSSECGGTFAHPPLHCNSRVRETNCKDNNNFSISNGFSNKSLSYSTSTCSPRNVPHRYRSAVHAAGSIRPYSCRRRVADSTPSSSCVAMAHKVCSAGRPRVQRILPKMDAG